MENFIEIQDLILLKPPPRNVIEFFLLISYARTKWVLNLWSHPPPCSTREATFQLEFTGKNVLDFILDKFTVFYSEEVNVVIDYNKI